MMTRTMMTKRLGKTPDSKASRGTMIGIVFASLLTLAWAPAALAAPRTWTFSGLPDPVSFAGSFTYDSVTQEVTCVDIQTGDTPALGPFDPAFQGARYTSGQSNSNGFSFSFYGTGPDGLYLMTMTFGPSRPLNDAATTNALFNEGESSGCNATYDSCPAGYRTDADNVFDCEADPLNCAGFPPPAVCATPTPTPVPTPLPTATPVTYCFTGQVTIPEPGNATAQMDVTPDYVLGSALLFAPNPGEESCLPVEGSDTLRTCFVSFTYFGTGQQPLYTTTASQLLGGSGFLANGIDVGVDTEFVLADFVNDFVFFTCGPRTSEPCVGVETWFSGTLSNLSTQGVNPQWQLCPTPTPVPTPTPAATGTPVATPTPAPTSTPFPVPESFVQLNDREEAPPADTYTIRSRVEVAPGGDPVGDGVANGVTAVVFESGSADGAFADYTQVDTFTWAPSQCKAVTNGRSLYCKDEASDSFFRLRGSAGKPQSYRINTVVRRRNFVPGKPFVTPLAGQAVIGDLNWLIETTTGLCEVTHNGERTTCRLKR